jgi:hypothetical protein
VLRKLTATGILAATATGVVLLGGPANADLLAAHRTAVPATNPIDGCYYGQVYYQPAWCTPSAPTVTVYPGVPNYPAYPAYPGYYGWHHRHYWPGRVYFRR